MVHQTRRWRTEGFKRDNVGCGLFACASRQVAAAVGWWLELEMERSLPFEVSLSEKDFNDVRVGPLRLNVRMDRVDEVEGGEVLIDYKTGLADAE